MQNAEENPTGDVNTQSVEKPSTSSSLLQPTKWFDLSTILNETPAAKSIIHYYEVNNTILPKHRELLNKLILNKTFSLKNKLTHEEKFEIAQQISFVFQTEKSVCLLYKQFFSNSNRIQIRYFL